jgi:hypothetical protein
VICFLLVWLVGLLVYLVYLVSEDVVSSLKVFLGDIELIWW